MICRWSSARGRRSGTVIISGRQTVLGTGFLLLRRLNPSSLASWSGSPASTPRSCVRISMRRVLVRSTLTTQGAISNDKDSASEPDDHGLGKSRGGWTTKAHLAVDGQGRPLSVVLTGGQAADTSYLEPVLDAIAVPGRNGCSRRDPDQILADKAYSSRANRRLLRGRGIKATIPERNDQLQHRRNRGPRGGRPYAFDRDAYRGRNVVERCFNRLKQWRGIATRYDKLARNYRAGIVLAGILLWTTA